MFTNSTANTHDIVRKQEAHLHNNKGDKRFCEGHKKFCEHETLYRCYDTGNCKGERITLFVCLKGYFGFIFVNYHILTVDCPMCH